MKQKTWELWVVPIIVALATGVLLLFLGLWLAGTPIRPSLSLEWLIPALSTSLPVWVTLVVLLATAIMTGLFLRQRVRTAEERNSAILSVRAAEDQVAKLDREHAGEIERLSAKKPRLHGIWNNSQTFWHLGRKGQEPVMQIGGWIDLTSSNTQEAIYLLAAYIDGQRADIFTDVAVKPNQVNREQVMLFMLPTLETDVSKSFTATIVVEDQYNTKHELPPHTFRSTPGQPPPPPTPSAEQPSPVLHASWRGDSVWGWATSHPQEDPIYMVRGDVTFLMDNIAEPVILTGVEIDGAESMGPFDNFKLDPRQPQTRGLRLNFRGKAPDGTDEYAVQLIFKDLRGNRYPTVAHRFKPLPIPERVGIQRGHPLG